MPSRSARTLRVAIIADTHMRTVSDDGLIKPQLPQSAWAVIDGADAVLHAGDLLDQGVMALLGRHAPLYAVLGNNDSALEGVLPERRLVELGGVSIGMVHDSGPSAGRARRLRRWFPAAGVVVFGHSHAPCEEIGLDGQLLFNPGSPTQRRAQPTRTIGELSISAGAVVGHRIVVLT